MEAALAPILEGFRWLGLDWDEGPEVGGPYGPYYQSQRGELYQQAVQQLLESGLAYRDYSQPEELAQEREAAQRQGKAFLYSRRWMAENDAQARRFPSQGRSAVVRPENASGRRVSLSRPDSRRRRVCLEQRAGSCHSTRRRQLLVPSGQRCGRSGVSDHARYSGDRTPLQHAPSVVHRQGLGYEPPQFAHLPYVAEPGGKDKLSKRKIAKYLKNVEFQQMYEHGVEIARKLGVPEDPEQFNPVLVGFYSQVGYLPSALLNYLVLLGWSFDDRTEDFSLAEMIESFSLERVNKAPAAFDPAKSDRFPAAITCNAWT